MVADIQTIGRLETLLRLYRAGYQSAIVDKTVEKLTALEITRLENELTQLQARLDAYEQQYGMSTEDFYLEFRAGALGDDMDFVEWSIFRDMHQNTLERLNLLTRPAMQSSSE